MVREGGTWPFPLTGTPPCKRPAVIPVYRNWRRFPKEVGGRRGRCCIGASNWTLEGGIRDMRPLPDPLLQDVGPGASTLWSVPWPWQCYA